MHSTGCDHRRPKPILTTGYEVGVVGRSRPKPMWGVGAGGIETRYCIPDSRRRVA